MPIPENQLLRATLEAIYSHAEQVANEQRRITDELERLNFPEPETQLFRAKAEFFGSYLEGQAKAVEEALDKACAGMLEKTIKALNFNQSSDLP